MRYLFWRKNGDVVLIDDPGFLVDGRGVGLLLQLFTGDPEQQVLLAVLRAQEFLENVPAFHGTHHLLEAACPGDHLLQCGRPGRKEVGVWGGSRSRSRERE